MAPILQHASLSSHPLVICTFVELPSVLSWPQPPGEPQGWRKREALPFLPWRLPFPPECRLGLENHSGPRLNVSPTVTVLGASLRVLRVLPPTAVAWREQWSMGSHPFSSQVPSLDISLGLP